MDDGSVVDSGATSRADTTDEGPTLRVEARFKNARLYQAIAARSVSLSHTRQGQSTHVHGPVKAFCVAHNLPLERVYRLLNLKLAPVTRRGRVVEYRRVCTRLAALLEVEPGWLFPAELYQITWPTLVAEVPHGPLMQRLSAAPRATLLLPASQDDAVMARELRDTLAGALSTLRPREEEVLRSTFGLDDDGSEQTQVEIAKRWGVSKERVRQVEAKALRKLRHVSRSRALRPYLE